MLGEALEGDSKYGVVSANSWLLTVSAVNHIVPQRQELGEVGDGEMRDEAQIVQPT
jgi:hypothetical protein